MPALCHLKWPWRREGLCISQLNPSLSPCGHRAEYTGSLGTQGLEVRSTEQSWACLSINPWTQRYFPPGVAMKVSGYQGVLLQSPTTQQLKTSVPCPGTMHPGT